MVYCTYCGQSFTRDEHLERHILTHTNVKPFKCFSCHMSFARRDLLQRHHNVIHGRDQNNQDGTQASSGIIPRSAGRTPIACNNCAKTKTKCDKKFPCSRCASRDLRCTLRPTRRGSKGATRTSFQSEITRNGSASEGIAIDSYKDSPKNSPSSQSQPQSQPQSQKPQMPSGNPTPENSRSPENAPGFYDQNSPPWTTQNIIISPKETFIQHTTPISVYDDFLQPSQEGSDQGASPRFMMDWSQMNVNGFDPTNRTDLVMSRDLDIEMNGLPTGPYADGMMGMVPEFSQPWSYSMSQIDKTFSDSELGSSGMIVYPSSAPSVSDSSTSDLNAIIAAQDGWNAFCCNPPIRSSSCPKTAKLNLERLEWSLRNDDAWSKWTSPWDDSESLGTEIVEVRPLHEVSRDKLLALAQQFLHKALDIHRDEESARLTPGVSRNRRGSNFVLLPPTRVLEHFLRSYANSFERYYPVTSRGVLDVNEILQSDHDKPTSLLVLMMISQGALVIPSMEAQWLTGGLTEACRISLFDVIEKNIVMAGNHIVLRTALLFTVQAAWSGDKWQMDIAMGQRGMYISMLRHSGFLLDDRVERQKRSMPTATDFWNDWTKNESRSRLTYSWMMVDQELALFHDAIPLLSVTEFEVPMPDADLLWQAKSSAEWSGIFDQVHEFVGGFSSVGSGVRPLGFRDFFRHFLDDELDALRIQPTPLNLRLLLHPLHSLAYQYRQLLRCFSDNMGSRQQNRIMTAASTRNHLEEVQSLLHRWYDLANRRMKVKQSCPMMTSNLVMFHLVSLNTVSDFLEVERLARHEGFDGTYQQLLWTHKRCISNVEETIFHCGQILRLIRSMPQGIRPLWWPGAIYRIALLMWADSLAHKENVTSSSGSFSLSRPSVAVDNLLPEHPLIFRYLTKREGVPTLMKLDGSQFPLYNNGYSVLSHCIAVIDEGFSTRFSDGIRSKLNRLQCRAVHYNLC